MNTTLPDYRGASIVNLMSTIAVAFNAPANDYPPLRSFDHAPLSAARSIVLLVVDGLGADYLARSCAGSNLHRHRVATLTSVFPSTTASAVTALLTGVAAQQHGLTGWHIYFKELGAVTAVLPLMPRHGGQTLKQSGIDANPLLSGTSIFERLPIPTYVVSPKEIVDSEFSMRYTRTAVRSGYQTLEQCFAAITEIVRAPGPRRFVHAYYPNLDATAHAFGIGSDNTAACFGRLDAAFTTFAADIAGSDTLVIVTADHGFIDSPPERVIDIAQHPELENMLVLPLCGERRTAYCYVHPGRTDDFEAYVRSEFAGRAQLERSPDLIACGWFGLGAVHPRLAERIGHYTLLMQDDWTIKDRLLCERQHKLIGVHGGISAAEMEVPLIIVAT